MAESGKTDEAIVDRFFESGGARSHPRKAGIRPGTYSTACLICDGEGYIRMSRFGSGFQTCVTCGGEGTVVRDGEREGDRRTQPTWGDVLRFSLMVAFFTAFGCYLLHIYAKVH